MAVAAAALVAAPALADPVQLTPPSTPLEPTPRQSPEPAPSAAQPPPPAVPAEAGPTATAPIPRAHSDALPPDLSPTAPAEEQAAAPAQAETAETAPAESAAPPSQSAQTPAPAAAPAPAAPAQAAAAPRVSPAPTATVSMAQRDDYTRLVFQFQGASTVTPLLQGNRLDLRFSRGADMDIAELRAAPPRFVRDTTRLSAPGAPVRLRLTLDPGTRQRHFIDGNRVVVDLLPPAAQPAQQAAQAGGANAPAAQAAPPASVTGNASVRLVEEANVTRVTVSWPGPARAAAFRRGEAVWLMFDADGQINLQGVARAGRRHQDVEIVRGEHVVGLRIPAPPDVLVSAEAQGDDWVFTLGARAETGAQATLERVTGDDGATQMTAQFNRPGVVRWINDPEIGDRIAVAMLQGPTIGVAARRATLEAAVLPAAQGAVVEPRADGVTAAFQNGALVVSRGGQGLLASRNEAPASDALGALESALADETLPDTPPRAPTSSENVRATLDDLMRRAAEEGMREGAQTSARMALARYLLEHELAAEALGALRMVAINQEELAEIDPEFRLMRGAANVMMGRIDEARADLGASALANDPSAALWRGYAAAEKLDWIEARRELERGLGALEQHPGSWRARFQLARAQAALELNDFAAAEQAARAVQGQATDMHMRLQARLIEARIEVSRGDPERALQMLDELSRARDEEAAVRASLEAVRLRLATHVMRPIDSVELLEALRFRWRGDALELEVIATLGEVYSELGRWRDALSTMRSVADRFPGDPAARRLRQDMATLFERLFLDGEADSLEPIQALGLFYEFSDLTPVGPNGDRIVRLLAGRLVHVDLLEQAAQLLQHQVDERLDGIGRAQVAADLAAIYLMDDKPDRALTTLGSSRQSNMPASLLAERRILEARALLDLGRLDHAVELVERDRSADAQRVRAEAAWRARDWERAGAELRTLLSMRDASKPLDASDRQAVLRAGVALTLAGDDAGVRALYRDFAGDMAGTPEADSFEVVAAGIHAEGSAIRDLARAVARTDLLERFMTDIRSRMTAEAAAAEAAQAGAQGGAPAPGAPNQPATPPGPAAALTPSSPRLQPQAARA